MISTYPKESNAQLSPHFNISEFKCPCPQCTTILLDEGLVAKLEAIRLQAGPIKINSGYRCQHYQDELTVRGYQTATGVSQHTLGRAADITGASGQYSGATLESFARSAGFKAVGVARDWIHCDLRSDKDRRWTYND